MKLSDKQQLILLILVFSLILAGEGTYAYFCLDERFQLQSQLNGLDKEERDA